MVLIIRNSTKFQNFPGQMGLIIRNFGPYYPQFRAVPELSRTVATMMNLSSPVLRTLQEYICVTSVSFQTYKLYGMPNLSILIPKYFQYTLLRSKHVALWLVSPIFSNFWSHGRYYMPPIQLLKISFYC